MKSSRLRVATRCAQNASTLGVCRRSRPKISRRSRHVVEVRLAGVARGRVAREPRGDDQVGAGPQQLQPGLVADLDAPAGQQRHASPQVGQLRPLREVEVAARRAQPVVEVMDDGVVLLADVAVLRRQAWSAARRRRGGKTLGVVNTGWRRSARMPVSARTRSSRRAAADFRSRTTAFTIMRRARASGL